ncbi:hypothetical protein [Magnetospirillum sp. UT-4]|uniref:hypothetical protein n=1 Tax=Magnetospirillum sp. UT-4 TaxID=2681467 RepID=UPI0020C4AA62|nr:hypothetical protein [Magnetospirillum sp. UT-4]
MSESWSAWLGGAAAGGGSARPATLEERVDVLESALEPLAYRLADFDRRLGAVEAAARKLESAPMHAAGKAEANGDEQAQLARLSTDLAALKTELEVLRKVAGDEGGAAKLSNAVEKAEASFRRMAERRDRAPVFLAVLGQLREAVDRGTAFELQIRAALTLGDKGLSDRLGPLLPHAGTGIATRVALAEGFTGVAQQARRAMAAAGASWVPPVLRRWLGAAVVVRRAEGGGEGAEAALDSALRLVAGGDLGAGVAAVRDVEGPAAEVLLPWVEAAEIRLRADATLSELSTAAMTVAASRDE